MLKNENIAALAEPAVGDTLNNAIFQKNKALYFLLFADIISEALYF